LKVGAEKVLWHQFRVHISFSAENLRQWVHCKIGLNLYALRIFHTVHHLKSGAPWHLPAGNLTYQWFRDDQAMAYATLGELVLPRVALGDQGVYSCRVTSNFGGSILSDSCHVIGELQGLFQ